MALPHGIRENPASAAFLYGYDDNRRLVTGLRLTLFLLYLYTIVSDSKMFYVRFWYSPKQLAN